MLSTSEAKVSDLEGCVESKQAECQRLQEAFAKLQAESLQLAQEAGGVDKKSLKSAIAKLNGAQEAMEGILTCMNCMEVYQTPMTYIPCGHTFCKSCVESSKDRNGGSYKCDECGESRPVKSVTSNTLIDEVAGKFSYQKQVLAGIQL